MGSQEWTTVTNGYLVQDTLGKQTFFFKTRSRPWAERAFSQLRAQKRSALISMFIMPAHARTLPDGDAVENSNSGVGCGSSSARSSASLATIKVNSATKMNWFLKCADQMGAGFTGSVEGAVASAEEFFDNPQIFFAKVAKAFENLRSFVENINLEFQSLQRLFAEMDASQVQEILCTWVGSLGANALMGIATGGASAYLLLKAVSSLRRVLVLMQTSLRLNRLHISNEFRGSGFLKEALACSY